MKKSILALAIACTVLGVNVMPAQAEEEAVTVTFTEDKKLEYNVAPDSNGQVNLGPAFEGVAPGEKRTQTISVVNNNSNTADFYMSAEAVRALEKETNSARGAGYEIKLTAGDVVLYDSTVGGYDSDDGEGSADGITEVNDTLDGDILIATLAKGQSTDVVLTIYFDGEAMGNTTANDYSLAEGQFAFNFKAGYEEPTGTKTVYKTVTQEKEGKIIRILEEIVPLAPVATGDSAMIGIGIAVLAAGIFLIVFGKKRKVEDEA